jgi:hypothetical protein
MGLELELTAYIEGDSKQDSEENFELDERGSDRKLEKIT